MTQDEAKLLCSRGALDLPPEAGVVGLGSGSARKLFIDEVGKLVAHETRAGRVRDQRGHPSARRGSEHPAAR
jgi:ribose 5-phosphate isomerase